MKTKYFLRFAAIIATTYLLMCFIYLDLDARNWGTHGRFMAIPLSLVIVILANNGAFENPYKQQDDEN
jgi:hypothetical protein